MTKYKKKDPFMKKDDPRNNYTEVIPIDETNKEEKEDENKIPEAVFTTASIIGVIVIAIYILLPLMGLILFIKFLEGISLA